MTIRMVLGFMINMLQTCNKKCEYSKSTGFILLSEIVLELYKNNYKISEIPTIFVNRVRGESKVI